MENNDEKLVELVEFLRPRLEYIQKCASGKDGEVLIDMAVDESCCSMLNKINEAVSPLNGKEEKTEGNGTENSNEVGNSVTMREALEKIKKLNRYDLGCIRSRKRREEFDAKILEIEKVVRAALAEPARNCDRFNTGDPLKDSEDAYDAWQRQCDDPSIPPSCKVESAFKYWLFAPETEQEGDEDGSK